MPEEPTRLTVSPDSDVARTLKAASEQTGAVVVDTGDARYHLAVGRIDRSTDGDDAVAFTIAGMRAGAGSWRDIDAEAFKAYLTERRRSSSRPPIRL